MENQVVIHNESSFRCDHWKDFSKKIQKWFKENFVLGFPIQLFFQSEGSPLKEVEPHALTIEFVQGNNHSNIDGYVTEQREFLNVFYKLGGNHIIMCGLPSCPDEYNDVNHINACQKVISEFFPQVIEKDPAKVQKIIEDIEKKQRRETEEAYIKACSARFDKLLSGTQKAIEDGHKAIKKMQDELVTKVREIRGSEQKFIQLEKARPTAEEEYKKEFQKFLSVPDIRRVEASDGLIKVFTNMIYIQHEGVKYQIGEFRIEVGVNGGLKFFNLTNKGEGPGKTCPSGFQGNTSYNRHHPHVKENGEACLGTISSAIPQLIGEYQYSVVAIVAIQFLKSVNVEDSAGKGIYSWPIAQ